METPRLMNTGLGLMSLSPFKSSLPSEFRADYDSFNSEEALNLAGNSTILSDVGQYLKNKDLLLDNYQNGILSMLDRNKDRLSSALQAELKSDPSSNYLRFKLLNEFALSQINVLDKLLSLDELNQVIEKSRHLKTAKEEIRLQQSNNSVLINELLSQQRGISVEDLGVLGTLISTNSALNERFDATGKELESILQLLNNQYLLALSFTNFEDLDIKQPTQAHVEGDDRDYEELVSHIVSAAVQKNVQLPSPAQGTAKSQWAKECLDSLLSQTLEDSSVVEVNRRKSIKDSEEKVTNLKTALNDLQFAHRYLTRQYEDERNLNSNVLEAHEKKKNVIEKKLSENIILLEKSNQRCILIEHEKNILEEKLDTKIKEALDLQRSCAQLKIENLGYVSNESSIFNKENRMSTSPLSGLQLTIDKDDKSFVYSSQNPKTPLLQQDINSYRSSPQSSPKFSSSISVLRKEFKKLVSEMQNNFESELQKEKTERKRLQKLVKLFEERDNELEI